MKLSKQAILQKLEEYQQDDLKTKGGNVWAYVYDSGIEQLEEIAMEAYKMYSDHNGLDFTVFPSLLRLENEIVGIIAPLFSNEPESIAGSFTSGGTESIILAVKAARDYASQHHPQIEKPEVILPITAHAAFFKACDYLNISPIVVPVGDDFKVDPQIVEDNITNNTILIVASAVNYSHGVLDPIEELSDLALKHNIWLHVDACIGGFILAYANKLNYSSHSFDFSLPGVSSLSVDLHKYAFTPKGASLVLYRNKDLRKYQFFTCTNWTGYPVINTTIQSTKSGGPLAACWATLNYIGEEGYEQLVEQILRTKEKMLQKFAAIKDLYVLGEPEASLIAFSSHTVDLFQIADEMRKKSWYIQVQPGNETFVPSIHLTITPVSEALIDRFFHDLQTVIDKVKLAPRVSLLNEIIAMLQTNIDVNNFTEPEMMNNLLQLAGIKEDGMLPEEMAAINELLRILPNEIASEAFLNITNELYKSVVKELK